ncbi:hypothetical protein AWB98_27165 [Mycolicibacterium conceptionense]|uniref:Helicase ATP-binding domain-containing protein n=1 Tax=Mycolicibacterium conceptionense TaxID=451644 RepID=A0ABX3V105_9MYCO|nr:DEAD/DEAH box helicase [Mycolicibacterium conceptionense]ORV21734.1 hypothetical protein AWB98_27165 [Mycolicibacterium conceptionense]
MPLDLGRINPGKRSKLLEPRDIFAALPDKKFPRLRAEQGEVLKAWFERRDQRDLVIKQNTGGGKTLVGLLIGQSSLNEGAGPVIYLVPDRYLITQVVDTANDLGIAVTTNVEDEQFRIGRSICVATFDKVVNGRTTFGVRGRTRIVRLGTVIVDDAHAALSAARHQFCPTLRSDSEGYGKLLSLFSADLKRQSLRGYTELESGDRGTPLRVPPRAVAERVDEMMSILLPLGENREIKSLYFGWPLISEDLALSVVTFTSRSVEIKTPCPRIDLIAAFADAPRRVYLTATLADEGVLVTELAADAGTVRKPITPDRASDLGDRLILAPQRINPDVDEEGVRQLVRDFADGDRNGDATLEAEPINVVVLVPSNERAKLWERFSDYILHVNDMGPVIDQMTSGQHVGVVVLVNKYDGVDLPDNACRLLVIDGIPTPLSGSEQREAAALTGSPTFDARKVQRLEQGMGRGIRDLQDYCAVLVLTREAALTLSDPKRLQFYSPVTRAQIDLSQQVADQIAAEGLDEIRNVLDIFLEREESWVSVSRAAVADVEYKRDGWVSPHTEARRQAFDKAVAGDTNAAVQLLRSSISSLADDLEKGWAMEELAGYEHHIDPAGSQKTLTNARISNPGVLRADVPPEPRRTRGPAQQAQAAAAYLSEKYDTPVTLILGIGSLFDNIVWAVAETHDLAEEQFRLLGLHLGFASSRPENEENSGPDVLWGLSPTSNAVIELKTEITRENPVIKKIEEAGQLLSSLQWDIDRNPDVTTRVPVLVHPSAVLSPNASLPPQARAITRPDLESLRADVEKFAKELVASGRWSDPTTVQDALTRNRLTAGAIISAHSTAISNA